VTTELDLPALRNEIDELDSQVLKLVARRIELVLKIGEYKRERGLPVYDAERERMVLHRLMQLAPAGLSPEVVQHIFERIIDECRGLEQHHTATNR
jgi:chorismate mutase-like protein